MNIAFIPVSTLNKIIELTTEIRNIANQCNYREIEKKAIEILKLVE